MRTLLDQRATTQLHTDVLRRLYSDVTVRIESQTDDVRKVHLVDQLGISRTYAVTRFHPQNWTEEVARIAAEIERGSSIGETFRSHGYNIHKTPICTVRVGISARLQRNFAATRSAGILHQYIFGVSKDGGSVINFATITEIYPPDLSDVLEKDGVLHVAHDTAPRYINDFADDLVLPAALVAR